MTYRLGEQCWLVRPVKAPQKTQPVTKNSNVPVLFKPPMNKATGSGKTPCC